MADRLGELTRPEWRSGSTTSAAPRLATGSLAGLVRNCHVVGVTTNPTIFQKAIGGSDHYDRQIHDLAARGVEAEEALRMITTFDVRWACDVLRPIYDASDGVDGRVSIEVDPRSRTTPRRPSPRPASCGGWSTGPTCSSRSPRRRPGCRRSPCLAEGISINVTLIFSRPRYAEVMDAFLDGMERARAAGRDLSRLASVASFFVSRVDTEVDQRLDAIGSAEAKALRGSGRDRQRPAGLPAATSEVFAPTAGRRSPRAGARPQRPLWASTGVKDPAYRRHPLRRRAGHRAAW